MSDDDDDDDEESHDLCISFVASAERRSLRCIAFSPAGHLLFLQRAIEVHLSFHTPLPHRMHTKRSDKSLSSSSYARRSLIPCNPMHVFLSCST